MEFTLQLQKVMVDNNYLIAIRDNFENLLIKSVLQVVEKKIKAEPLNLNIKNRIFGVVVECVQNICKSGDTSLKENTSEKKSVLLINRIDNGYQVVAGGKINEDHKIRLEKLLNLLSNKPIEQIKQLRLATMKDRTEFDQEKRENLALIDLYLKSGNNVSYIFDEDEDGIFFMVQIKIFK